MKDFMKKIGKAIKNYFAPEYHHHEFGPWQVAPKGLAGAFTGEIAIGSIQYRKCSDKKCEYIEAEKII